MKTVKRYTIDIFTIIFFLSVFFLSIKPLTDFDIWFHLKSGEIFTKMGIITHDVFSQTAYGRVWFPYEWLFQVFMYEVQQIFGFNFISIVIGGFATFQTILIYFVLRKILGLGKISSLIVVFFYFTSIFESIVARPEIVAFTFLLVNLSLLLFYYLKSKNWLIVSIPITLLWVNMHGSIFLDVLFFAGFTALALIQYFFTKEKTWLKKSKILAIFTLINSIATILPPLGTMQYQLLWRFFQNQKLISTYIDEWNPLSTNPYGFAIYTTTAVVITGIWIFAVWRKKILEYIWALPFLMLLITPYLASRNIYIAVIALTFILGSAFFYLSPEVEKNKLFKKIAIIFCVVFIAAQSYLLWQKYSFSMPFYYPTGAVKFLNTHRINGNMFNEYAYGGYLLYHLYPNYKVFIDGRTDIYLCCEMPATLDIAIKKNLPDKQFSEYMYSHIWNPYRISFVLLPTEKHTILAKITRLLENDPGWNLVFWDDSAQIYVRNDGKNDGLIREFQAKYATPYLQNIYVKDHQKQALQEYQRMDSIVKSARTSNAIGFIYLQNKDLVNAAQKFQEAISIYPNFESPYMNLAEINAYQGYYQEAIILYQKALIIAPDRGLIYIRLGELYMQGFKDSENAKKYWQEGVDNASDPNDIKTLKQLLFTI